MKICNSHLKHEEDLQQMKQPPLTGISYFLLIFSLGLAIFVDGLDYSIANVAIPSIAGSFGVTPQEGTWVITLFAVSNAITLALTGWLATRYGSVKVILWSVGAFTIVSLFCGLAWNFNVLVFFRILQGGVAGPLMALPQSLFLANCPEDKKSTGMGCLLMIMLVAPVLGPVIGGWITQNYGWPWIFYINLPLGIIAVLGIWALLHNRETRIEKMPVDLTGIILLSLGVGALQVFLDRGNDADWFESTEIILLALVASVSLILFISWNLYADYPVIEFSFFRDRNFLAGTLLTTMPYLVLMGTMVLLPLYVQTQMNYTPLWAGIVGMPIGILPIFATPLVALILPYVSWRLLISISFMLFAYTFFWSASLNLNASVSQFMLPRFVQGLGISLCFLPLQQLALSNISESSLTKATGVYNFMRLICGGGGVSTALFVTAWQRRAALHHNDLSNVLQPLRNPTVDIYERLNSLGMDDQTIAHYFNSVVTNESYAIGFNDLMWASGWLMVFLIPFLWFCREPLTKKTSFSLE